MKWTILTASILLSYQSMALTIIHDAQIDDKNVVSANRYLRFNSLPPQEISTDSLKGQIPGLPAKSQLQAGMFDAYKLSECQTYPTPFFVIGLDELSMAWLDKHRAHLKDIHALGFITNINTEKELKEAEAISPIYLIPSNIDALAEVIKAPAYPFFTNGCEVWQ